MKQTVLELNIQSVQQRFKVSAKVAKNYCLNNAKLGKRIKGVQYYLIDKCITSDDVKQFKELAQPEIEILNDEDKSIKYLLEWLEEGNVDIDAWLNDPLKRPPQHFIKD